MTEEGQPQSSPLSLQDRYDWIVLGDDPGVLFSAALAARLGMSVLVLPLSQTRSLARVQDGVRFDPEPNFLVGGLGPEGDQGLLVRCLRQVGLENVLIPIERMQFLFPGHRVTFQRARSACQREVARESPENVGLAESLDRALDSFGREVRDYWSRLPDRLAFQEGEDAKRRWLRLRLKRSPDFRGVLKQAVGQPLSSADRLWLKHQGLERAPTLFWEWFLRTSLGISLKTDDANPSLGRAFEQLALAQSAASFPGGMTAYRSHLSKEARRLGATFADSVPCRGILIRDGRFFGVQVAQRASVIEGGALGLGCGLDVAREYLTTTERKRRFMRGLRTAPEPNGWCFSIAIRVSPQGIPVGMVSPLVWQDPGAPALMIEFSREEGLVYLRTYLPFTPETLGGDYQRKVAARMFRQWMELAPFIEFHVQRIYPDFRENDSEILEAYGFPSLGLIPENLRRYPGRGVGSDSGIPGIRVLTGEAFPELGTLGPVVSALNALCELAQQKGLSGPFG